MIIIEKFRIFIVLFLFSLVILSCSRQKRIESLLADKLKKECSDYSPIYTTIADTITLSKLRQDVRANDISIASNKSLIEIHETSIIDYQANQTKCKNDMVSSGYSWVVDSYLNLIKDYDKMILDSKDKISKLSANNDSLKSEITLANGFLNARKDSIAYFKVLHKYVCGGLEKIEKYRISYDVKLIK